MVIVMQGTTRATLRGGAYRLPRGVDPVGVRHNTGVPSVQKVATAGENARATAAGCAATARTTTKAKTATATRTAKAAAATATEGSQATRGATTRQKLFASAVLQSRSGC